MRKDELDKEWVTLMLEAKEIGLTIEEIRDYFAEKSKNSELETKKTVHG
ncbi:Anti-repressor SinI [Salinibacillus kushneri]|uniref:Anti-repressor SinI n=1 Tax=Salinibacillus kushneri TaxID=237682 RepID=A0A1I0ERR8_9BACI|nr:anti-repressor SinI family protein [Salinibacillus kushneri]SET48195.1 Anti-repressor SinI [Salinibacillus kushneri]